MNDEFLHSLRRPPPARFARELKRKLHAQDAETKRRAWLLRARTIAFLIVASAAFAGGMLAVKRHPAEKESLAQPQAQVAAEVEATPPVPTTDNPSGAAANVSGQSASGGLIRTTQPRLRVATSPLTEALVRRALRLDTNASEVETMEADSAFAALCVPRSDSQFDMIVTSRRVISVEFTNCQNDGGTNIVELKLGYQALVLTSVRDSAPMKLSPGDVYLAIAKQIPDPIVEPSRLIPNPNVTWDQIGKFEYRPIMVFGPARGTPLRTLFETLLLEPGCNTQPALKAMQDSNPDRHAELCHTLRGDRLYSEIEQNALLIPQYLWGDPTPLVLIDYQFYRDNRSQLGGSAMAGPEPSYATIADGSYPLARPIYLYVDQARMVRSREAYEAVRDLDGLSIFRSVDPSFVELDDRERVEQRSRRLRKLSSTDLVNE